MEGESAGGAGLPRHHRPRQLRRLRQLLLAPEGWGVSEISAMLGLLHNPLTELASSVMVADLQEQSGAPLRLVKVPVVLVAIPEGRYTTQLQHSPLPVDVDKDRAHRVDVPVEGGQVQDSPHKLQERIGSEQNLKIY